MSATQKFFRKLFAATGDRAAVPDLTPPDGSINYETGYGFDYQRAAADPLYKAPERDKLNQVLYDLTLGLRQYQTHGFPEYIQPADNGGAAFAYDKNAFVLWTDGQVYQSLVAANTSDPTDTTKWQLAILGTGVGAVQFFPSATAPTGYVKANGALLSRAAYPVLWAYAQASGNLAVSDGAWTSGQFSPGDGATTFRIPDLRGYHVRAVDEGRGVDAGRVLGSVQADLIGSHTHGITDPGHSHGISDPGHVHGVTDPGHSHTLPTDVSGASDLLTLNSSPNADESPTGAATGVSGSGVSVNGAFSGVSAVANVSGVSVQAAGGAETRVKNVALLGCIKYM